MNRTDDAGILRPLVTDGWRMVRTPIINQDQLEILEGLLNNAFDAFLQVEICIVNRNADRNERIHQTPCF